MHMRSYFETVLFHQGTLGPKTTNYKYRRSDFSFKYIFFLKVVWIWSLHLQWKFKLWAGKFAWGVKAKHCWALSTNFWKMHPAFPQWQVNFPATNLNIHWSWRWWDKIQAIFLNLFYFTWNFEVKWLISVYFVPLKTLMVYS